MATEDERLGNTDESTELTGTSDSDSVSNDPAGDNGEEIGSAVEERVSIRFRAWLLFPRTLPRVSEVKAAVGTFTGGE